MMSGSTMTKMAAVLGAVAGLAFGSTARADERIVGRKALPIVGVATPVSFKGVPEVFGNVFPPGSALYDNTTDTGYYFPPPAGAVPCEVADDVPYTGTWHVTYFAFGYVTDQTGDQEVIVNFYGALGSDDRPAGTPVQSLDLTGLPGGPDGSLQAWDILVDLVDYGEDFDWTNSTSGDGTYHFNWVSFTFQQQGAGLLTATGGSSMDLFWTGTDLRSPYGSGSFFWNFGGTPEGSFHIQIFGTTN